jgi:hypothetical protein
MDVLLHQRFVIIVAPKTKNHLASIHRAKAYLRKQGNICLSMLDWKF